MREFGAVILESSLARDLSAIGVKRNLSSTGDKAYWATDDTCETHGLRL